MHEPRSSRLGLSAALRRFAKGPVSVGLLNRLLLTLPVLYRLPFVNFEAHLGKRKAAELLALVGEAAKLPGAVVECGVARGGSAVLMAQHLRSLGASTPIIAIDSFQGFDSAELKAERAQGLLQEVPDDAFTSTSLDYVRRKVATLGLGETITLLDGYFADVLPTLGDTKVCMAFIDCDLRQSIAYCAETLWPQIVPGGLMVFDDYEGRHFRGARLAIDEFVGRTGVDSDSHGLSCALYWVRKPSA